MEKRIVVTKRLDHESFYDILDQNTPEQVIGIMQAYIESCKGQDIYFNVASYGYDGGIQLELWERRLETDEEFEKRIAKEAVAKAKEKKAKAAKREKELAEYQRLKKKFEK